MLQCMAECVTHKRMYHTLRLAEDALIDAHIRFNYRNTNGPVAIYKCDDCGHYHFTSKGNMNARLAEAIANGTIKKQQEISRWEDKFRNR